MNFKAIFEDDNAVSPVIGVILMVAITVILAAVIATFVLGLGDNLSNTSPQASFDADLDTSGTDDVLTISHTNGQAIPKSELTVNAATGSSTTWDTGSNSKMEAGDYVEITAPGNSVKLIWTSSESGQTATIYTWNR